MFAFVSLFKKFLTIFSRPCSANGGSINSVLHKLLFTSYSFRTELQFLTDTYDDTVVKISNSDIQKIIGSILFCPFISWTNNDMQSLQTTVFYFWPVYKGSMLSNGNRNPSKLRQQHNIEGQYIKEIKSITGLEKKVYRNLIRKLIMSTHFMWEKILL